MTKKLFMFEKPLGMRDTLPFLYEIKKRVRQAMIREIETWGYELIETPTLEHVSGKNPNRPQLRDWLQYDDFGA